MSTPARRRRFPWIVFAVVFVLIVLAALAPLIGVAAASFIAEQNGCVLNEAGINECVVDGRDIGRTLYTFFVLGWFMIATIPLGAGALLVWLAVLVVMLILHARRRDRETGQPS